MQRKLGLAVVAMALWIAPAGAADVPLTAGKVVKFKNKDGTAGDQAIVKFVKDPLLSGNIADPLCPAVTTIRFKTDLQDVTATLDCNFWTLTGSGYTYNDPGASADGVQKVKFTTKPNGGKLLLKLRGDQYGANAIAGPIDFLEVTFAVDATNYCGRFDSPPSTLKKNDGEKIIMKGPSLACIPPPTPTGTVTQTGTATVTQTPTRTPSVTRTPTQSATATATATGTATFTGTATHTATHTATPTDTVPPGSTPTNTGTATQTPTITATFTETPTDTPTATPTATPIPPSVFRIDTLALRDPHIFVVPIIGCSDVTNPPGVLGFSVNNEIASTIGADENMDGNLDLSLVALMRPLQQPPLGGADIEIRTADCTTPVGGEICTPDANPGSPTTYVNQSAGTCLSLLPGTSGPNNSGSYSPATTLSSAPCFSTSPVTINFPFGLFTVPLQNVQGSARYADTPATQLVDGLLVGFLSETDANMILLPSDLPVVGGQPLSKFLPGGSGSCASHTAKDTGPLGQPGWYFYLNFTAHLVTWTGS